MQTSLALPESVRDRLLADHVALEELLERLIEAFEADDRKEMQRLWTSFETRLSKHLAAEDKYLIPSLLCTHERQARTLMVDHQEIRTQLAELGEHLDLHMVRLESARRLAEDLRAHARYEDKIYQWADDELGQDNQSSLIASTARGSAGRSPAS
jgi:hypothetical protein